MNYPQNYVDSNALRIEIAVLEEDIKDSSNPGTHKFSIPCLCTGQNIGTIVNQAHNIANKKYLKSKVSITTFDQYIDLKVPVEYTYFYGNKVVPKGTRFIIAFIGGNMNDIKIIGRYDNIEEE